MTTRLAALAAPAEVTTFALNVTLPAVVLVTVALSMIAVQFTAVYCVVWAFSACFDATRVLV
ncbi:hypothetical protein D3C86_2133120 [compost metagenome]